MKRVKKGFSIIEAILALAILALLAGVFVPAAAKVRQRVKDRMVYGQIDSVVKTGKAYLQERTIERVPYETLVREKRVKQLESVQGEKYDGIIIGKDGGTVSVALPDGRTLSREY